MNRHDIFWKTAVRIRDTYRDHIKGEEAYAYSEAAARELQDAGLLAPDTDHPATLTTKADFATAPIGTVVTHPWGAAVKAHEDWWLVTGSDRSRLDNSVGDQDEPLTVLRWGNEEGTHR